MNMWVLGVALIGVLLLGIPQAAGVWSIEYGVSVEYGIDCPDRKSVV